MEPKPSNTKQFFDGGASQAPSQRNMMTLYFIGYRLLVDGKSPAVAVKGRKYQLPVLGESMEVDTVIATDLITRMQMYDPTIGYIRAFTTNPDEARAVARAFKEGTLGDSLKVYDDILKNQAVQDLTDEELELELARRKPKKPLTKSKESE